MLITPIAGHVLSLAAMFSAAAAPAGDWPQFHGPRRDNISADKNLLKRWPEGGPKMMWKTGQMGHGYASLAVAGGRIYTGGNVGRDTVITAMDLGGKVVWRKKNGSAYQRDQPGARGTPTIVDGKLYHLGGGGDVACFDAKTGQRVWSRNILKEFNGRDIRWGLAESLLVDGENVICCPGGEEISMVALNRRTGKTVWTCRGAGDKPGYASPVVFEYKGLRQIVTLMSASAVGVDAATGKLLWKFPHPAAFDENILQPIYHDGHVFVSTGHGRGGVLLELDVRGEGCSVTPAWRCPEIDSQHGGIVLVDGHLYGHAHRRGRWVCVEFRTGKLTCSSAEPRAGSGCLTWADGMLYLMTQRGTVALASAGPKAIEVVSRFNLPKNGRGTSWAHPVVCGGRLYLRHGEWVYAYNVRAK